MRTLFLLLLTLSAAANAEQYVAMGDYSVHYSAFSTEILTPEVARSYGITRSKNLAMLNISVLKKGADGLDRPVDAEIDATAINLSGQLREVDTRIIEEQDARYHVGFVRVSNEETLRFSISVRIIGETEPVEVNFEKKFYTG